MSIEAMKQALEALETCMYPQQKQIQAITSLRQAIEQAEKQENEMSYSERKKQPQVQGFLDYDDKRAINRRIEHLSNKEHQNAFDRNELTALKNILTALNFWQCLDAAKEHPEKQEPVAWGFFFEDGEASNELFDTKEAGEKWLASEDCLWAGSIRPLYTTPQPQEFVCSTGLCHYKTAAPVQEPVIQRVMARLADLLDEDQFNEIDGMVTSAGYTPPTPQREWVGLTDGLKLILIKNAPNWTVIQLIEETEQLLKDQNS